MAAVRQAFFQQLAKIVPAQLVTAAVGMTDFQQAALTVVTVVGFSTVRVCLLGDIALTVALVLPARFTSLDINELTIEVVITGRFVFWRDHGHQASGIAVLILGDGPHRVFYCDQTTLIVIGFLRFPAIGSGLADQTRILVMHVDMLAAVGVVSSH